MLSRREMLARAAAAAALAAVGRPRPLWAKASQPATPVDFPVPPGACDTHTHIFGDPKRFPFTSPRAYTPETASIAEMQSLHRALRMDRVVIVSPSVYGTDNSCTIDALKQFGARARGIAVIDAKTSNAALDELQRGGMRGIRINLETVGQTDPEIARQRLREALQRVEGRNLHVQIYTRPSVIAAIEALVQGATVPIVFDHFGGAQASKGVAQPGFDTLVKLVQAGKAYVKVSAVYRASDRAPDYPDVTPLAKRLIEANPQRILWGSDWPHPDSAQVPGRKFTDIAPLTQIDDGKSLNQFATWATEAATRKTILVDNPARLYGF